MSEIVKIENLSFRYMRGTVPALSDINLSVRAGEFIGITGPAGAGKTTLLSCINGVIPHYYAGELQGRVVVDGLEIATRTLRELAGHIGFVLKIRISGVVSITVEEEIAFGPENLGIPPHEIELRIQDALQKDGHLKPSRTCDQHAFGWTETTGRNFRSSWYAPQGPLAR